MRHAAELRSNLSSIYDGWEILLQCFRIEQNDNT